MKELSKRIVTMALLSLFGSYAGSASAQQSGLSPVNCFPLGQPVSYYIVSPPAPVRPQADTADCQPVTYAQPTAAPTSAVKPQSKEPQSTFKPAPNIIESRSQSIGSQNVLASAPSEQCQVGFWNLLGRDVSLQVEGKTHFLKQDKSITLAVARQFVWQIDQEESHQESVSDDKSTYEIVLRK